MKEFRRKQKRLKRIMNILIYISVAFIIIYCGAEPMLIKSIGTSATAVISYIMYALIIACLAVLFTYTSKYGKSDKFLESVENELEDIGYYYTSREESNIDAYADVVIDDLRSQGFSVNENEELNDFTFDAAARKSKEYFYIIKIDDLDKNDVVAYIDTVIYDITAVNIKRRCNAVIMFLCDTADDGAISLSKMITPLGKKETIKIAVSIVELSTKRVYFLGNKTTKCQQMIANYAMNCNVPIKDEYKGSEKLQFQYDLEEHMKTFNIKDFKNGNFYAH